MANLLSLTERAADPGAFTDTGIIYTKDVGGVTQLFYEASDGTVTRISLTGGGSISKGTNPYAGDGFDGVVTFDGAATVLGLVPSGNVYTLLRDIWPLTMTVNTGITIKANGFRVFVKGTLTLSGTAKIHDNGNDGVLDAPGAARATTYLKGTIVGGAGGAGGGGGGGNGAGGTVTPTPFFPATAGATHGLNATLVGQSGGGGNGQGTSPTANTNTIATASQGGEDIIALLRGISSGVNPQQYSWGQSASGGGSGDGVPGTGGGGGAGGGCVIVCCGTLAGSGTIEAKGGNGGNGIIGASTVKGGGGGGGAGGGLAVVIFMTNTGTVTATTAGGTGGLRGALGASENGGNGFRGYVAQFNLSGDVTVV